MALLCIWVPSTQATTWGLNSLGDSVYWSQAIALVRVKSIERLEKPQDKASKFRGFADVTVQVKECLKGTLPAEIRITKLDLGDPTLNASPAEPLPDKLIGLDLLVFVTPLGEDKSAYKAGRGWVEDGVVKGMAFSGVREKPLVDMRAIITELVLVQRNCPIARHDVTNEAAALAACHTALHSQYPEVVWYGARRLLDRPIPAHFVDDLAVLAHREKSSFPVRYLLVRCLGKAKEKKAVPILIEILRRDEKDTYVQKALEELTGESYGTDLAKWRAWWNKHEEHQKK